MIDLMKESGNISAVDEDRLQTVYQACVPVYTDGSKDPNTGISVSLNISVNRRTSDHVSVYTVEMMAIATALQCIEETQIRPFHLMHIA